MFIPTKDSFFKMTPEEFEQYSLCILQEQISGLKNIKFENNAIIETNDDNYQIDGVIRFEVLGMKYTALVECKHYKFSINREKVQILFKK